MKILIAYDGSKCADAAVMDMQRAGIPKNAEALIVHVIDRSGPPTVAKAEMREAKAIVDTAQQWMHSHFPGWTITSQVVCGSPAVAILEQARSWHPDLIVVGSHGRSIAGRVFLGSVSLKLSHEALCSIRVVRERYPGEGPIRILAGIDESAQASAVIQEIARRPWPARTEVRIVSVVESIMPVVNTLPTAYASEAAISALQNSRDRLHEMLQELCRKSSDRLQEAGLTVSEAHLEGDPKQLVLLEAARWNAEVIFIGARGMGRLEELLLGSVSNSVLKHAHCAVEIVRTADWVNAAGSRNS